MHISVSGILAVAGLHVAAITLLATLDAVKLPPQMEALMVHVIQPEPPKTHEIAPTLSKPAALQADPKIR